MNKSYHQMTREEKIKAIEELPLSKKEKKKNEKGVQDKKRSKKVL